MVGLNTSQYHTVDGWYRTKQQLTRQTKAQKNVLVTIPMVIHTKKFRNIDNLDNTRLLQ